MTTRPDQKSLDTYAKLAEALVPAVWELKVIPDAETVKDMAEAYWPNLSEKATLSVIKELRKLLPDLPSKKGQRNPARYVDMAKELYGQFNSFPTYAQVASAAAKKWGNDLPKYSITKIYHQLIGLLPDLYLKAPETRKQIAEATKLVDKGIRLREDLLAEVPHLIASLECVPSRRALRAYLLPKFGELPPVQLKLLQGAVAPEVGKKLHQNQRQQKILRAELRLPTIEMEIMAEFSKAFGGDISAAVAMNNRALLYLMHSNSISLDHALRGAKAMSESEIESMKLVLRKLDLKRYANVS